MNQCKFCNIEISANRNISAIYCSDLCKTKAYRQRKNIPEPFQKRYVTETDFEEEPSKSYTCCEKGRFYSPLGLWGQILKCDSCGQTWYTPEYYKDLQNKSFNS
jgi:hypothetical protein